MMDSRTPSGPPAKASRSPRISGWTSVAATLGLSLGGLMLTAALVLLAGGAPGVACLALAGVAVLAIVAGVALAAVGRRADATGDALEALEALLGDQPDLLLDMDRQGKVAAAYGYAPEGVSADLLFEQGLPALAAPLERIALEAALRQAAEDGRADTGFAPSGALERWVAVELRRRPAGRLVATLRDATRDRAREAGLEAARADAESMAAGKSRFLANMSHELRTPLNAIMGFSDIMRAKMFGVLPGKYVEYADLIHESGRHLLDLINDVLDMSKIEAERYELSLEDFDAREPVSAALRLLRLQADEAGIHLRGVLPAAALDVEADRRALKQIVINLVSNALKFTPKGGSVTVTLRADAETCELVVADTGMGIAPEDLARLGKPFEQAGDTTQRARGAGLGLSLVRAFSELHGGAMTIESVLGEGTAVTVRLPVVLQQRAAPIDDGKVVAFKPQR